MDLSNISLASLSLDSNVCGDIVCGTNGLPLTPNSIKIIGDFKASVEHVEHPNLTKYVECFRNKNERVTLVFENLPADPPPKFDAFRIAKQLLDALDHLHNSIDCVHGLITDKSIVWSGTDLKLTHWPINLLTNLGSALGATTLLSTDISFLAPEQVRKPNRGPSHMSDIYSACLSLLKILKPSCKISENPCRLAFCDNCYQLIERLEGSLSDEDIEGSSKWNLFFSRALEPNPNKRANLIELYSILELERLDTTDIQLKFVSDLSFKDKQRNDLSKLNISEIYYLWRLSIGRNLESEQKQDDCPPIFKVPYFIATEKQASQVSDFKLKNHIIIDTKLKFIPLEKFKIDISCLDEKIFNPLKLTDDEILLDLDGKSISTSESSIVSKEFNNNHNSSSSNSNDRVIENFTFADLDDVSTQSNIQNQVIESSKILPIVIKEADFAYQCRRIILFKRLLASCPLLRDQLIKEASVDIPPYYRARTWCILLDVSEVQSKILYETIDKTTPIATDRQISVDIPRCHQYNELMASPQGHQKLARILKAWLNYNMAEYVYWQGLDSLAAPFLLLNFDNEALAFSCFNAFINKYLRGFFKKDNQLIVQQYLAMFSELLSYHDPSLASHLESLGFSPNLYAIPWFLTMFTHVLPLHKVLHVWDCLLLGDEKFPLCIGLAILNQLRQELMEYNFNDCIVAFSDMPEIDIERCIRDASHFYNSTPDKLIDLSIGSLT